MDPRINVNFLCTGKISLHRPNTNVKTSFTFKIVLFWFVASCSLENHIRHHNTTLTVLQSAINVKQEVLNKQQSNFQ
jgi:hypothetical protein